MRLGHAVILLLGFHLESVATAFSLSNAGFFTPSARYLNSLSATPSSSLETPEFSPDLEKNELYIQGLIENLTQVLDRWVVLQTLAKQSQVQTILNQIRRESKIETLTVTAYRLAKRAGFPLEVWNELSTREREAEERQKWERFRKTTEEVGEMVGRGVEQQEHEQQARSALSARKQKSGQKPDLFLGQVDSKLDDSSNLKSREDDDINPDAIQDAQLITSELVAQAGSDFDGETMGIGGLDDVLSQVKRRIWIPLAAPPILLEELGISPVRGLLLYGRPGCGKTLIARTIGKILSPSRPVTVVSGPELMDKFVGSSEQNVRKVFDAPPPVYDHIRLREDGEALSKVALHVIILDEFDAMARARGGKSGSGDQGEAGVARDSVVNQILAKMDGVDPLPVPTLVIGLTNKRSLIDSALLRPGRFEVQIEVPPPRTQEQRVSILNVHMKTMFEAGRLLVTNAPAGTAAGRYVQNALTTENIPTYDMAVNEIAKECEEFSGASLAGVARAAASHALQRTVIGYSTTSSSVNGSSGRVNGDGAVSMLDCLVTFNDLKLAVGDVNESSGDSDWGENEEVKNKKNGSKNDKKSSNDDDSSTQKN